MRTRCTLDRTSRSRRNPAIVQGGIVLVSLGLLLAAGRFALGQCPDSCPLSARGVTALVTAPTGNPNLSMSQSSTFSSRHTLSVNGVANNVNCSFSWSGKLYTDEGLSNSLMKTGGWISSWNAQCPNGAIFTNTLSKSYQPPASGPYNAVAETTQGSQTTLDNQPFTAVP